MHFGVLNCEKQHKEGTCKVSGRSVVFSAFYADFCLCPKLLIITTLNRFFCLPCKIGEGEGGEREDMSTYTKRSRRDSVPGLGEGEFVRIPLEAGLMFNL